MLKMLNVFLKSSIWLWTTLINGFITSSENGSGKRSHSWHRTDANCAGSCSPRNLHWLSLTTILRTKYNFNPQLTNKNLRHTEFENVPKLHSCKAGAKLHLIPTQPLYFSTWKVIGWSTVEWEDNFKIGWWEMKGRTNEWMGRYVH